MPFPYSPHGWWKADAIPGPPADGAVVATWPDSSGNGRDLGRANAAERPTFKANLKNGLPGVRFDGANDVLGTAYAPSGTAGEVMVVLIPQVIPGTGGAMLAVGNDAGGGQNQAMRLENRSDLARPAQYVSQVWDGADKSVGSTTLPVAGTCVLVNGDAANGGNAHIRVNKILENTGPAIGVMAVVGNQYTIGRADFGAGPFQGDILEVLYWDRVLTAPERDDTAQQLLNKYALPGAALTNIVWAGLATFTVAPVLVVTAAVAWASTATFAVAGNAAVVAAVAWAAVAVWSPLPVLPVVGASVAWVARGAWAVQPFAYGVAPFVSVGFRLPDWGAGHISREMEQDKSDAGLTANTELLNNWIGREGD